MEQKLSLKPRCQVVTFDSRQLLTIWPISEEYKYRCEVEDDEDVDVDAAPAPPLGARSAKAVSSSKSSMVKAGV